MESCARSDCARYRAAGHDRRVDHRGGDRGERSALVQIDGAWHALRRPARELVARAPCEVAPLLAAVEAEADAGRYVAGFVAYEAGAAFGLCCHDPGPGVPLAHFVAFDACEPFDLAEVVPAAVPGAADWTPGMDAPAHAHALGRIRAHLAAGDTYQVNLTFPLSGPFDGDPRALFASLARAQRSPYATYLDFDRFAVACASPELFFARDGETVTMRPMKGTAARGRTLVEDRARRAALRRSPKERAENLMIVDMVRNDLGRVAHTGSVAVPELFRVERFPTIHQMTSTVTARTSATLPELFAATFPCASVTGAPKVRTMQLIREIEGGPRGVYTGAAGYVAPGGRAQFAVAIRTLVADRAAGRATYSVGSGIVWDSRPEREYAECLAKAAILTAAPQPFSLLETLRWDPRAGYALLDRHMARLAASARYFAIPLDRARVRRALVGCARGGAPLRVRLLVDEAGAPSVEAAPVAPPAPGPVRIGLGRAPVDPRDPFLSHKTTRRETHEAAAASRPDCDQAILWAAGGYVTETTIANIALLRDGRWVTPPVREGLLAGTARAALLADGTLTEGRIWVDELRPEAELAVFNSVSGWRDAVFVPGG